MRATPDTPTPETARSASGSIAPDHARSSLPRIAQGGGFRYILHLLLFHPASTRPMHSLLRPIAFAAAGVAIIAACGDPTGSGGTKPPPVPPTPVASISGVTLTAGGAGVVTGTNLDGLPSTLTVDGQSVTVASKTATEIRFTLPQLRACETDGRPVNLVIGSINRTEPLDVPAALSLNPGESRVLGRAEMDACLEIAAGPGLYVLTALHPATSAPDWPISAPLDTLLEVRTWTYSGTASASTAAMPATRSNVRLSGTHAPHNEILASHNGPYSDDPHQYDPRYATAQAGDTVPFPDFSAGACVGTPAQTPNYPVRILAAEGRAVVALDLRLENHAHLLTPEALGHFHSLATRVDSVLLPATRMVFGSSFEPARGFGGRYVMMLSTRTRRGHGSIEGPEVEASCPNASEMVVGGFGIDSQYPINESSIAGLAGVFLHEYGHAADVLMGRRVDPSDFGSYGFLREGFAEQMQESGSRLLAGRLIDSPFVQLEKRIGALGAVHPFHGVGPTTTPFGPDVRGGQGHYEHGASMLLFARDLTGEALTATPPTTIHQRMLAANRWDLPYLAQLTGRSAEQFMDEWSLALATDGLAPAGSPLPSFRSWQKEPAMMPNVGSRVQAARYTMATGLGNYAALYFGDTGSDANKGVSLQFSRVSATPFKARLTRIR